MFAGSIDPDKMAHNEPPYVDPLVFDFSIMITWNIFSLPLRDEYRELLILP